jgi:hypothetical protein
MRYFILECKGGLGNQLHCYFFGKILSVINNKPFYLDILSYDKEIYKRSFILNKIIKDEIKILNYVCKICFKLKKIFLKYLSFFIPLNLKFFVIDNNKFNSKIFITKYTFNPYFSGYWQSYKYYENYENIVRNSIQLPIIENLKTKKILKKIISENSCFVHFRSYEEEFGNRLSFNYYLKALDKMKDKLKKVVFYVFSDNIFLAKTFLKKIKYKLNFVDIKLESPINKTINDFTLMSKCKHAVIGDSTFSWWAAWLNSSKKKIVICPSGLPYLKEDKKWTPKNWIQIKI